MIGGAAASCTYEVVLLIEAILPNLDIDFITILDRSVIWALYPDYCCLLVVSEIYSTVNSQRDSAT